MTGITGDPPEGNAARAGRTEARGGGPGAPAGRRRRVPRREREQQIIDVGVRVFAKRGYHAASVDEIAELAGISKPMVYLYLDSKEGLFLACLRRESDRLVAAFQGAARAGGAPEERLYAGLAAFFVFVAAHRDSWVLLHRQAAELGVTIAAAVAEVRRLVMAEVAGLVGDGITDSGHGSVPGGAGTGGPGAPPGGTDAGRGALLGAEDADFVAHALVGAADTLADWMKRHPGQSPDGIALRLMNMVWVGMRHVLDGEVWTPPDA